MAAVHETADRVGSCERVEPVPPTCPRPTGQPPPGDAATAVRCGVAPRSGSVKHARDFTAQTLRTWSLDRLGDVMELLVSELVTNALRHGLTEGSGGTTAGAETSDPAGTCTPVELILVSKSPHLLCIVTDPGDDVPALGDPEDLAESGRGLRVVDSCSRRWGWATFATGGKAVWAMVHDDV